MIEFDLSSRPQFGSDSCRLIIHYSCDCWITRYSPSSQITACKVVTLENKRVCLLTFLRPKDYTWFMLTYKGKQFNFRYVE